MSGPDLRTALRAVMQRGAHAELTETEFNDLALGAFHHQFELNQPYRRYCERRDCTPAVVVDWTQIAAVPTAAFKEVPLLAGQPTDARLVFRTSGTTRGTERRGAHYILDPTLYDSSLLPTFRAYVLHDAPGMRMLSLIPAATEQPESSLSYMASTIVRELGAHQSGFFMTARAGLQLDELRSVLAETAAGTEPVCLLGTSLAFAHLLDSMMDLQLHLPAGSRLMDTGGFKGEHHSVTAREMRARYQTAFGIPPDLCVNEYGMTELCSQYYDAGYFGENTVKQGPPWLRARVVDPETLAPVTRGEVGILQHLDLANLDSVCAILTEDLAFETDNGFVLLGRAPGAMPRGCSIAMDIMLADAIAG